MYNLSVKDMSCSHCVASITKAVSLLPSVAELKVDLTKKTVSFTASATDLIAAKEAIAGLGFTVADLA